MEVYEMKCYRYYVAILLWLLMMITAPLSIILCRLDRRFPPSHCPKCGYDLTWNVSGKCPECGTLVQHAAPKARGHVAT
jgi:predicted amidophosphoribosyltransferase